ncbi:hypothetical protein [Prolixibacter bellariivorans]|uniref:hypothetical protein n=1 Tax=Prolixibacter bellariivorans TaxID=314319 RepID=UPI0011DCB05E|nr:hypothetical protein [Prolixibacter bellariivorans]
MTIERMNKISAMKILLLFTMVLVFCPAMAQNELLQLLQAAEEANPNLEAGRKLKEAQQWEYRTGLTPSDPEIEFGFMPGNSDELGDKKIFSATQSSISLRFIITEINWPTVVPINRKWITAISDSNYYSKLNLPIMSWCIRKSATGI